MRVNIKYYRVFKNLIEINWNNVINYGKGLTYNFASSADRYDCISFADLSSIVDDFLRHVVGWWDHISFSDETALRIFVFHEACLVVEIKTLEPLVVEGLVQLYSHFGVFFQKAPDQLLRLTAVLLPARQIELKFVIYCHLYCFFLWFMVKWQWAR